MQAFGRPPSFPNGHGSLYAYQTRSHHFHGSAIRLHTGLDASVPTDTDEMRWADRDPRKCLKTRVAFFWRLLVGGTCRRLCGWEGEVRMGSQLLHRLKRSEKDVTLRSIALDALDLIMRMPSSPHLLHCTRHVTSNVITAASYYHSPSGRRPSQGPRSSSQIVPT